MSDIQVLVDVQHLSTGLGGPTVRCHAVGERADATRCGKAVRTMTAVRTAWTDDLVQLLRCPACVKSLESR